MCSLLWLLVFGDDASGGAGVLMALFVVVFLLLVGFGVASVRC